MKELATILLVIICFLAGGPLYSELRRHIWRK
jgi:hypothetical protein